jgi:hypothetical protein
MAYRPELNPGPEQTTAAGWISIAGTAFLGRRALHMVPVAPRI